MQLLQIRESKITSILSAMPNRGVSGAIDSEEPLLSGAEGTRRETLLQSLRQKGIYFEKTVAASYAATNPKHCAMALPAWFVAAHGDKFEQSVLLWSGSSQASNWRVQLSIALQPPNLRPEVKFSGGWRAFAADNGLTVGDALIFCLRAMSQFDVYIFRVAKSSIRQSTSVLAPTRTRKRSRNFDLLKEKLAVNKKSKKDVGCRRRYPTVSDKTVGRVTSEDHVFEKRLTPCAVSKSFQLTLPTGFMHQHAESIRQYVELQPAEGGETWTVKVNIYYPEKRPQFIFDCGAWKDFVVSNGLVEGDRVTFILVPFSKFQVRIRRRDENPNAWCPVLQRPVKRSRSASALSQAWQPAMKSRRHHGKSIVKMEGGILGFEYLKRAEKEVGAYSASDSSECPSDVDSHTIERRCQRTVGIKQEDVSTTFNNRTWSAPQSRNTAVTRPEVNGWKQLIM